MRCRCVYAFTNAFRIGGIDVGCAQLEGETDMTQTALNTWVTLPADTWTLISEIDCTFVVVSGIVEVLGMDGAAPVEADRGIPYANGAGEDASVAMLSRFPGSGTADRIYMISRGETGSVFVSRAAVS
jgi:hypothetical protein